MLPEAGGGPLRALAARFIILSQLTLCLALRHGMGAVKDEVGVGDSDLGSALPVILDGTTSPGGSAALVPGMVP